jgi:hypothetical protein
MTVTGDFVTGQPVSFASMRRTLQIYPVQEGVYAAGDLQVTQRAAGVNQSVDVATGDAWVLINSITGLCRVRNDAVANVTLSASNGSNPRIDRLILRYNDTSIPTGSGNIPTLEKLDGTATSGATLNNLTGATAVPNNCLLLADILVPTSSTTVSNTQIRDRRPWAVGACCRIVRTAADYTTTSTTIGGIDATNLNPRIECSGVLLRATLRTTCRSNTAGGLIDFDIGIDGAAQGLVREVGSTGYPANMNFALCMTWEVTPSAGSHQVAPMWKSGNVAHTALAAASAAFPLEWTVEEVVRQNTANNTTTSG